MSYIYSYFSPNCPKRVNYPLPECPCQKGKDPRRLLVVSDKNYNELFERCICPRVDSLGGTKNALGTMIARVMKIKFHGVAFLYGNEIKYILMCMGIDDTNWFGFKKGVYSGHGYRPVD